MIMFKIFSISLSLIAFFVVLPTQSQNYSWKWGNPINIRSLNSSKDDFAPSWNEFEKRLYFSSTRNGKSKFFISTIIDSITFEPPTELKDPLNKTPGNLSYISFLSETEAILNAFHGGRRQSFLNIFYAQRRTGSWQKPIPLDSLQCECFVLHPSISPDGRTIVFASDKEQEGNLDLFSATLRPDGSWGEITNLVDINTDGNEITPFFASQDTLYFASDGYGGPGGFDLFFSTRGDGYWTKPLPLSELNTRFNESDFVVLPDGRAVFASDRPDGVGGLDLYLAFKVITKPAAGEEVPELVLSISAQVPSVRVLKEFEYDLFEIPTSVPQQYVDKLRDFAEDFKDEAMCRPRLDTIYGNILSIYLNRLVKTKLRLTITFDSSNYILKNLIYGTTNKFLEKFPNMESNLTLTPSGTEGVVFHSGDSALFEPLQLGEYRYFFEPSQLDVTLSAIPNNMVLYSEFGVSGMLMTYTDSTLPVNFSIPLKTEAFDIKYLEHQLGDTLLLNFNVQDTLGRGFSKTYPILLNKSYRSLQKVYKYQNRTYQKVSFFNLKKDFQQKISFDVLFNRILQFKDYIKSFVVLPDENLEESIVDEFIQLLREKFQLSPDKIAIEAASSLQPIVDFKPEAKSIILLIEKR